MSQSKKPICFYPVNLDGARDKYLISPEGLVLSIKVQRLLNPRIETNGYYYVSIHYKNSHNYPLHRLLALTFLPNPDNLPEVNHKDGNKLNNDLSNLEWVTGSNNVRHAFKTGLSKYNAIMDYSDLDIVINRLLTDESSNYESICKEMGISNKGGSLHKLIERHLLREGKEALLRELNSTMSLRKGQATAKRIKATELETNQTLEFKSLKEAADHYGISHANVCRCCKSGKTSRGILFEYA